MERKDKEKAVRMAGGLGSIVDSTSSVKATVIRRSVSLDRDVDALAHDLVGDTNFSAFVNDAVRQKAQRMQMHKLLDDFDAEFGPPSDEAVRKADALWETASRSTQER